jgi:nucleoside-diphosphate-sugar epimerase
VRVLVTGHHGYIGAVVAPLLQEAGHDVVGLDTFFYRGCDFGEETLSIEERQGDVRDVSAGELEGFEAVVHLAALSNDPVGDLNSDWTFAINLEGTIHLARAAKDAGVARFLFASSCSMYGASSEDAYLDEDAPLQPLTPYAVSKVRAESALAGLADESFSPVYLRNATAYGASPRLRVDVVLNNLVGWAFTTGRIRLLSDGSSWRPIVHIRDIGRSILGALSAPREVIHDRAFNIGATSENYRIRELAEIVHGELPDCDVEFASDASNDPRSYRVQFARFEETFPEHRPEWDARRGVEELVAAYTRVGLTSDLFEGGRYMRLKQIKRLIDERRVDDDLRWSALTR